MEEKIVKGKCSLFEDILVEKVTNLRLNSAYIPISK
jgi:hypothetical protein